MPHVFSHMVVKEGVHYTYMSIVVNVWADVTAVMFMQLIIVEGSKEKIIRKCTIMFMKHSINVGIRFQL